MIFIYEDFNFADLRAGRGNCFYNFFRNALTKNGCIWSPSRRAFTKYSSGRQRPESKTSVKKRNFS